MKIEDAAKILELNGELTKEIGSFPFVGGL